MITVTSVRIYPFDTAGTGGKVRAYAEVEINGCLTVKGIRVMQAEAGGYFLSYPSQRVRKDNFIDLLVPDREAARVIREAVMTEFKNSMEADTPEGK